MPENRKSLNAAPYDYSGQTAEIRLCDAEGTDTDSSTPTTIGGVIKASVSLTLKYFLAKLLASVVIGFVSAIVFSLLGMPLPWLWGLIAGVGNAIPLVGQWLSIILIVAVLSFVEPVFALYALITLLVLQVLDEFLISPLIVGKALSIKPLAVILVALLAGMLFGGWGVIFAVPIASIIKLIAEVISRKRDSAKS